jgi:hypothetical protein
MEATAQILQLVCEAKARSDPLRPRKLSDASPPNCVAQNATGRSAIAYAERSLYFSFINNFNTYIDMITITMWGLELILLPTLRYGRISKLSRVNPNLRIESYSELPNVRKLILQFRVDVAIVPRLCCERNRVSSYGNL